jgi:hypothetical protein
MQLTRRTFVSSTLAVGLAAAAEATHSSWLLTSGDAVRIGIADIDSSNAEHVALLSAIPGAEIAALFGTNRELTRESFFQLQESGKPMPILYGTLNRMLLDRSLEAVYLAGRSLDASEAFSRIIQAGHPVMADPPHEVSRGDRYSPLTTAYSAKTHILLRTNYLANSNSVQDVRNWLLRSDARETEAILSLPLFAQRDQVRSAGILSLACLIGASDLSPAELLRWHSSKTPKVRTTGSSGTISLPDNSYGLRSLRIHALGGDADSSTLALHHSHGSFHLPIVRNSCPQAALRSAMLFLTRVRFRRKVNNADAVHALVASQLMQVLQKRV